MCGICGVFVPENQTVVPSADIRSMNDTLRHRGPDDEGIYVGPGIGLGHRRLSIIDVAGGHQPISNEDGSIFVLLNGEIYNYGELHQELAGRGHRFTTCSDTECIVHLYEELGAQCFSRLRGMFAIAIYDARQRRLVLARDRLGKKPLFYASLKDRLIFGSELKALLTSDKFPRDMDPQALSDYFSFGYVPAPKTIYRAARKLRPGHYLVATRFGAWEQRYWKLSFRSDDDRSEQGWCDAILSSLEEATRIRLMSEVPLGAFLSGGVDSSAVVAMMCRTSTNEVTTCSITFADPDFNEGEHARRIATRFDTRHFEHRIQPQAVEVMAKLAWHYDEPFADTSAVPTYYLSKAARERVTVALGGDGGDENFAGYTHYIFDQLENRLRRVVPASARAAVFRPLGRVYPSLGWAPRMFRARRTFQSLARDPLGGYFNSISLFQSSEKADLFAPDFQASLEGYDSQSVLEEYYLACDSEDPLSRIQYVDINTYLPDDILVKVDRASMAVGLEVRAPLLDHKLTEMAASIPSPLKLAGMRGKYIFKKALEPILPRETLYRPKQGFGIPFKQWFRRELREFAYDALFSTQDRVLNRSYIAKLWQQHQSLQADRSHLLWAVLMYLQWQNTFSGSVVGSSSQKAMA
jgi:asparagine synthase (glutamine-hydrolysing)